MASADVIRAGVSVAVALLLNEMSILLGRKEEKDICLGKGVDQEKESARCIWYAYEGVGLRR
jgi:hypothetical protein